MNLQIDYSHAKRLYNKTASTYHDAAIIPNEIAQRLVDRLTFIKINPSVIVEIGCGVGNLLPALKETYPDAQVIGLDLAIERLKKCVLLTIAADAHTLPFADHSVDFIVSNISLHATLNLEGIFKEIKRILKPGGLFLFSTLGPDTLNTLAQALAQEDYPNVLPFYDMHDIGDALLRQGFKDPVMDAERITLEYKTTDQLFQDLKNMGETNVFANRRKTLTGKKRQGDSKNFLKNQYVTEKLPMIFEIIYGHAWGAPPKPTAQNPSEFRINVADIKRTPVANPNKT